MLAELADVLSREKFKEVEKPQVDSFLWILSSRVVLVTVKQSFEAVPEDPDDNIILSTAHEGRVSYIVSGDRHLLNLKRFDGIRIITVDEMLQIM